MFFKLFLIFTIVPVIELAILIKAGSYLGVWNTVAIVILTAVIGAHMVRSEGIGVMQRLQRNMTEGIFPAEELIDGVMILLAGALLLTPGFFTDIIGFLAVFPLSRSVIKETVKRYLENRISSGDIHVHRY